MMKTFNAPPPTFVYFDLGGVLIKDFSTGDKGAEMLKQLGVSPSDAPRFRELWAKHAAPRVNIDYGADEFHAIIEQEFGVQIPENYSLLQHGFVDRFEPNPSIESALDMLKNRVELGLLTNMYPQMLKAIKAKRGLMPTVSWDVVIDSSEVKLQKPELAIFECATNMAGKPKEQILFIDNTEGHLDAAAAYGWRTYYYNSADYERSSEQLGKYLLKLLP
jgi:HAD superfamily hydrolase (TIGR01509 family)